MIGLANAVLGRAGLMLVPAPPSGQMLREHANVSEQHHPSRGGETVRWMRAVADSCPPEGQCSCHRSLWWWTRQAWQTRTALPFPQGAAAGYRIWRRNRKDRHT